MDSLKLEMFETVFKIPVSYNKGSVTAVGLQMLSVTQPFLINYSQII